MKSPTTLNSGKKFLLIGKLSAAVSAGCLSLLLASAPGAMAQTTVTLTTNSVSPWTVPLGVTSINVQMWGGGGAGGGQLFTPTKLGGGGGGGGGGGFTTSIGMAVTQGQQIAFTVGNGGTGGTNNGANGGNTTFGALPTANGGSGGVAATDANTNGVGGIGGTGGNFSGGTGGTGATGVGGGGGGGGAGTAANGNNASGTNGAVAVTGGGAGANGPNASANGVAGGAPGGGGSGAWEKSTGTGGRTGGMGGDGQIVITYTASASSEPVLETVPTPSAISFSQTLADSSLTGGVCTNISGAVVAGSFAYTTPTIAPQVGTTNVSVTFTPTDTTDYNSINFNVNVLVNLGVPTIATNPVANVYYGETLGQGDLTPGFMTNAIGTNVPGTFAFTSPNTAPGMGTAEQSVTFTPTDDTNYAVVMFNISVSVADMVSTTLTTNSVSPWTVPSYVTAITVEVWGGGGGGGGSLTNNTASAGGGGGGGAIEIYSNITVTPGSTIPFTIGLGGTGGVSANPGNNGGNGGTTTFNGTDTAVGGAGGSGATSSVVDGPGGAGGVGLFNGGTGVNGSSESAYGGAGGSGAGTNENGTVGTTYVAAATAPGGGTAGNGADKSGSDGDVGNAPGGGGGGNYESGGTLKKGGDGGAGWVTILNVSVGGPPPQPQITKITLSGANLIINGVNGAPVTYYLYTSTSMSIPVTQWTPVSTNVLTASGAFSVTATNAVTPGSKAQFYILQAQ